MLLNVTRPLVGVGLSIVAMILSIAGLASTVWFKCSFGSNEIKLGLKRGSFSGDSGYGYVNFEESMCSDVGKLLLNGDVPCVTGQAALGLGVTAVLLLAAAAAMGALIAFKRQTGGLWGGALSLNIVGGVLALVSGAGYMGRMTDYFNANEFCDAGQSAPILMIISGLLAFASSGLFCSCCCRPATNVPNLTLQQVPAQLWQASPQQMGMQPQMMAVGVPQPQMDMQQQQQWQQQQQQWQQPMPMQAQQTYMV